MEHKVEITQRIDGDYPSFWASCPCGWKDRTHRGAPRGWGTREKAKDKAKQHVLIATANEEAAF